MRRLLAALAGATLAITPASLSNAAEAVLTLDQALARALAHHPALGALEATARSRSSGEQAEKRRRMGEVSAQAAFQRQSDDMLIRPMTRDLLASGPENMPFDDAYGSWSVGYHLPLYSGGALASATRAAQQGAAAARAGLLRATASLRHQVLATYAGLLSLDGQIVAWEQEKQALASLLEHIRLGEQAGRLAHVDSLKAQVRIQEAQARLADLRGRRASLDARLAALLGEERPPAGGYVVAAIPAPELGSLENEEALIAIALTRRSDLRQARHLEQERQAEAQVARAARRPQVQLDARLHGVHAAGYSFNDTYWTVAATASIPLSDMGRRRHLAERREHLARAAALNTRDLEGRIRAEVRSALAALRTARAALGAHRAALELAREVARLEQLKYDSGRGNIDDLLAARARLRGAESNLLQARNDLIVAADDLRTTIEGEIP
ncbi:MAG: TolC family protein [Acidobacteriota bacterium]|nr:TolC family protein [Acidobacteriota bacterium]MDQ7086327.1 TolC family protein [Acidobacteriota bacterium]